MQALDRAAGLAEVILDRDPPAINETQNEVIGRLRITDEGQVFRFQLTGQDENIIGAQLVAGFDDRIAAVAIFINIAVAAATADQHVVAAVASQRVISRAACECVVIVVALKRVAARVAGAGDRAAGECQMLNRIAQYIVDRRDDAIKAALDVFDDHVAGVVDVVGIVAAAATQDVAARAAVDHIAAIAAGDVVVAGVAVQVERAAKGRC